MNVFVSLGLHHSADFYSDRSREGARGKETIALKPPSVQQGLGLNLGCTHGRAVHYPTELLY